MQSFPLNWPPTWPRSKQTEYSRFGKLSIETGKNEIMHELRLMNATKIIISSNLILRIDGFPKSGQRQPEDLGVAVYFELKGNSQCIPCDRWKRIQDNMRAIAKTVDALRGIGRWGADKMVDAAFTGFKALPTGSGDNRPWNEILGVFENATFEECQEAYKKMAFLHHPDKGGSEAEMVAINAAWSSAKIIAG